MVQVKLMVLLCIIPLACRRDLCHNSVIPPLGIRLLRYIFCFLLLFLVVVENRRAVLRTPIRTLAVGSGRIVHLVKVLDECAVGDLLGVEDDLASFGV